MSTQTAKVQRNVVLLAPQNKIEHFGVSCSRMVWELDGYSYRMEEEFVTDFARRGGAHEHHLRVWLVRVFGWGLTSTIKDYQTVAKF